MNPSQITLIPSDATCDKANFNAVFAVPTPVHDDSGITHLVEHLVFSSSDTFPSAWNLSNLLHLTPYKINASVTHGLAYFHVSATNKRDFYLLLSYLWAGLMQREYSTTRVQHECRVITHELQMHYRDVTYRRQCDLWLSDNSAQRYRNYGGYGHSIGQLTPDDVRAYKTSYFRCDTIMLFIQGLTASERDEWLAMQPLSAYQLDHADRHNRLLYQPKQQPNPASRTTNTTDQSVATWWLPPTLADALSSEHGKQQMTELRREHPSLWLDIEPNATGYLALRLIANDWQVTWQNLMADLTVQQPQVCNQPLPKLATADLKALPASVQQMVAQCEQLQALLQPRHLNIAADTAADTATIRSLRDCYGLLIEILNTPPQVSPLKTFDLTQNQKHGSGSITAFDNRLCRESMNYDFVAPVNERQNGNVKPDELIGALQCSPSLRHGRYLPRSVATDITQRLANNTSELAPWIDYRRWLYPLPFDKEPLLYSLAISGQLWKPRTDGWLYAMGVGQWTTEHHSLWVLWGVADEAPQQTVTWLERLLYPNRRTTDANHQH